jgi:hypothetical protein
MPSWTKCPRFGLSSYAIIFTAVPVIRSLWQKAEDNDIVDIGRPFPAGDQNPMVMGRKSTTAYYATGHDLVVKGLNVNVSNSTWFLMDPLQETRRNHDCFIHNDKLINIFGRWSRSVETRDLITGESSIYKVSDHEKDPDGWPLANLNHVSGVFVDSLSQPGNHEIWLPCGFHNDAVDDEISINYSRIVDLETMKVRVGPRLSRTGGACAGAPVHLTGADNPPHICAFGGTDGSHVNGTYLADITCYDREHHVWNKPFGQLPYGLDHGNAALIEKGICHEDDPARVLIMNFRIEPYGQAHSEILAFDFPHEPLGARNASGADPWYIFAQNNDSERVEMGRDASGVVVADGGRYIFNFGGISCIHYHQPEHKLPTTFDTVRVFDVCSRKWSNLDSLGLPLFAVQTCASQSLNVAVTCGGTSPHLWPRKPESFSYNQNFDQCVVTKIDGYDFDSLRQR